MSYVPLKSRILTASVLSRAYERLTPAEREHIERASTMLADSLRGSSRNPVGAGVCREIVAALGRLLEERQ